MRERLVFEHRLCFDSGQSTLVIECPVVLPLFGNYYWKNGKTGLLHGLGHHSPLTFVGSKAYMIKGDSIVPDVMRAEDDIPFEMLQRLIPRPSCLTDHVDDPWGIGPQGEAYRRNICSLVKPEIEVDHYSAFRLLPRIDMDGNIHFGKVVVSTSTVDRCVQHEVVFWLPSENEICKVRIDGNNRVVLVYQIRLSLTGINFTSRYWLSSFWEQLPWVVRSALMQKVFPSSSFAHLRSVIFNPGEESKLLLKARGPWRELQSLLEHSIRLVPGERRREEIRFAEALAKQNHHLVVA